MVNPAGDMPQVPLKTPRASRDARENPDAKHYAIVLRSGIANQAFTFSLDNDSSAMTSALFLAMQYFPKVNAVEVYRKDGPDPNDMSDVREGICKVALSDMMSFVAPLMEKLTGYVPPAVRELATIIDKDSDSAKDGASRLRGEKGGPQEAQKPPGEKKKVVKGR